MKSPDQSRFGATGFLLFAFVIISFIVLVVRPPQNPPWFIRWDQEPVMPEEVRAVWRTLPRTVDVSDCDIGSSEDKYDPDFLSQLVSGAIVCSDGGPCRTVPRIVYERDEDLHRITRVTGGSLVDHKAFPAALRDWEDKSRVVWEASVEDNLTHAQSIPVKLPNGKTLSATISEIKKEKLPTVRIVAYLDVPAALTFPVVAFEGGGIYTSNSPEIPVTIEMVTEIKPHVSVIPVEALGSHAATGERVIIWAAEQTMETCGLHWKPVRRSVIRGDLVEWCESGICKRITRSEQTGTGFVAGHLVEVSPLSHEHVWVRKTPVGSQP